MLNVSLSVNLKLHLKSVMLRDLNGVHSFSVLSISATYCYSVVLSPAASQLVIKVKVGY